MIKKYGTRNSLLLAPMPTASTAHLIRNNESFEAPQGIIFSRQVNAGGFTVVNHHVTKDFEKLGIWHPKLIEFIAACQGTLKYLIRFIEDHAELFPHLFEERSPNSSGNISLTLIADVREQLRWLVTKYKTQYEISQKTYLKYARQRAIYIDQSQSTNVHIRDPTVNKLKAIHSLGNKLRLKTGMYYLRQDPARDLGKFSLSTEILTYYDSIIGENEKKVSPIIPGATIGEVCTRQKDCLSCQ